MKKITLITVVLNDYAGMIKTLNSLAPIKDLVSQHIIIDGLSSDATLVVSTKYKTESNYNVDILSEKDSGIFDAMNKGIDLINDSESYVLFMNAGDEFSCSDFDAFNKSIQCDKDIIFYNSRVVYNSKSFIKPHKQTDNFFVYETPIHQAVLFSRRILVHNKYDLSFKVQADTKLIYQLLKFGCSTAYNPIVISNFYYGGLSSNYESWRKCLEQFSEQIFIMVRLNNKGFYFIIKQAVIYLMKFSFNKILGRSLFSRLHFWIIK
jgi:putative colanic acid biosynthesis glycosyltransferase